MTPAEEILDIVDENDEVIGRAPRGEAYARGMRHRCVFIQARDAQGRIFVHRRTATKLVFPSQYDMFVGGVVGAGESYDAAALREAEEELGVSGLPRPVPLFNTSHGPSAVIEIAPVMLALAKGGLYLKTISIGPVTPQAEEVAWHAFLPEEELEQRLGEWEWVPDGLEAYERLRAFRAA